MQSTGFPIAVRRAASQRAFKAQPLPRAKSGGSLMQGSILWLLSAGSFTYAVVALAIFGWLSVSGVNLKASAGSVLASLRNSSSSDAREAFLRQMNFEHKREVATQINYVSSIISKVGKVGNSEAQNLSKTIVLESRTQNLDPLFVAAVIKIESTFKRHAVSHRGATGLMQIMPATGRWVSSRQDIDWDGLKTLRDPATNIRLGIAYLKELKASFRGNSEHALIAYNWGPGNLFNALKNRTPIPNCTRQYARTVLKDHKRWKADFTQQYAQNNRNKTRQVVG